MPSPQPLPTIEQLVQAATGSASGDAPSGALQGERNEYGDGRSGSLYNHAAGPAAVLFAREARRDKDIFADTYDDDASGWALTRRLQAKTGIQRILDTYGAGTSQWTRSSASAGSNWILRGTRVQVPGTTPMAYQVASDTYVSGTSAAIPVQALTVGTGVAIQASANLQLLDPVYDPLWLPQAITCADGTDFESAADYRARVRKELIDSRTGYPSELIIACQEAGATYVIPLASQYGLAANVFTDDDTSMSGVTVTTFGAVPLALTPQPHGLVTGEYVSFTGAPYYASQLNQGWPVTVIDATHFTVPVPQLPGSQQFRVTMTSGGRADYGLNAIYVADANYQSPATLINACDVALEGVRVLGAELWVGGVVQTPVTLVGLVSLRDKPGNLPLVNIRRALTQAMLGYFASNPGGYTFKRNAIASVMRQASGYVQTVNWTDITGGSYGNVGIYVNGALQTADPVLVSSSFPATLSRYTLVPNAISLYFIPPV